VVLNREVNRFGQEQFAQAKAAVFLPDSDSDDVRLVNHEPDAYVAGDEFRGGRHAAPAAEDTEEPAALGLLFVPHRRMAAIDDDEVAGQAVR